MLKLIRNLNYFKTLNKKFEKRVTKFLFKTRATTLDRTLEISYQISLLIAKSGENHTVEENLIKPLIPVFLKTVLENDDKSHVTQ